MFPKKLPMLTLIMCVGTCMRAFIGVSVCMSACVYTVTRKRKTFEAAWHAKAKPPLE